MISKLKKKTPHSIVAGSNSTNKTYSTSLQMLTISYKNAHINKCT